MIACYDDESCTIHIDARAVDGLSDEGLRALLAHETIHAWRSLTIPGLVPGEDPADEAEVHEVCRRLGFAWKAEYEREYAGMRYPTCGSLATDHTSPQHSQRQ